MNFKPRAAFPGVVLSLALLAFGHPLAARAAEAAHAHPIPHRLAAFVHVEPVAPPVWSDASGSWRQTGVASWYGGRRWQGRRTSSGARYDENLLTAAHATLPLGSRVRVVVPSTGRSVIVTINDRPGTRTRIIDLSRAAAARLGILHRGVATVTLLPVDISG